MVTHTNFYETIKEADMRLRHTIVMYDGEPYYVLLVANHKNDGVFRIYLDKCGDPNGFTFQKTTVPYHISPDMSANAAAMDEWLTANPNTSVIRKMMNSPKFDKFRPFPLGMVNFQGGVSYLERRPVRHSQQGLTDNMLKEHVISLADKNLMRRLGLSTLSYETYLTIMGKYPTAQESLDALKDDTISNTAIAFNRKFAFVRGPASTMFLAYKSDIVGFMPEGGLNRVNIANTFAHTKEVVTDLGIFGDIKVLA